MITKKSRLFKFTDLAMALLKLVLVRVMCQKMRAP